MEQNPLQQQALSGDVSRDRIGAHPHFKLPGPSLDEAVQTHQQGNLTAALEEYERLLQQEPDHAEAIHLSGVVLHQQGNHRAAIKRIERAIQLKPDAVLFRKNLASAYRSAGDLEIARRLCERVLKHEPQDAVVLQMLGRIYEQQKDNDCAVQNYLKALDARPQEAERFEILIHIGDCYSRLGQHERAIPLLQQAVQLKPTSLVAQHNLGREYQFSERLSEAEASYLHALEIDRNCSSAWNNLGVIYQTRGEHQKGKNSLEEAIRLNPELPDAYNNLANVTEGLGETAGCRELFLKAIELRPDYAEAHHSLSQLHLRDQDFATGWDLYAWRYRKKDHDHRPYRHPVWQGQPLRNERLLVFSEQGVGDIVLFGTCLPDVAERVEQITLEVEPRLQALFQRSFPSLEVICRPETDEPCPSRIEGIDYQISIADLPRLFRNKVEDFPRQHSLLKPDAELLKKWQSRYAELGDGLKIGISWSGGKNVDLRKRRSIPLAQWQSLLKLPGLHFINLQYGNHSEEIRKASNATGIPIHDWSDSDPLKDLDDFSAKLSALDLVISIDNATIHFAGALGVPTWCLLNKLADWRWFHGSFSTPWYETLKLFRQSTQGDWEPVLQEVEAALLKQAPPSSEPSTPVPIEKEMTPPVGSVEVKTKPRCAIISPVGPGHEAIYHEAARSIRDACVRSSGPFREVIPFRIDDHQGDIGRSRARNFAVQEAARQGIEWVFFLDADDMLVPDAFANVEPYLEHYDAIWGQIFSFEDGSQEAVRREGQLGATDQFVEILKVDPFHSLQMGHFVRTDVALQHPFLETLDVGEDFHYYLRIWQKHRCIKIGEPLFANRRGRHSTGPRSATGRDWTVRVNQMLNDFRAQYFAPKNHLPARNANEISPLSSPMKLTIYGMMRSGTTLLCDKLTVPHKGLILLEPNMHLGGWPEHLLKQLCDFGLDISEQEWKQASQEIPFEVYFQREILPRLQQLDYWGVKLVNFSNWQTFLNRYPAEHLLLCVRDIRDVVLSGLDLAPRLNNFVDAGWIERRAIETARSLVEMSQLPHRLIRYEDLCQQPDLINGLAGELGFPELEDHRMSLEAVPHRKYEQEKHQEAISSRSVGRFDREPEGPARELAERVWGQCAEYQERFGYPS